MKSARSGKNTRRPGAEWRFTAPNRDGDEVWRLDGKGTSEVDEVVIDDWLHVERMNADTYWVRIGTHAFHVKVSRNRKRASIATRQTEDSDGN